MSRIVFGGMLKEWDSEVGGQPTYRWRDASSGRYAIGMLLLNMWFITGYRGLVRISACLVICNTSDLPWSITLIFEPWHSICLSIHRSEWIHETWSWCWSYQLHLWPSPRGMWKIIVQGIIFPWWRKPLFFTSHAILSVTVKITITFVTLERHAFPLCI